MAEFCLDRLRELDGGSYRAEEWVLSDKLELCEGCGQWKHVVVTRRRQSLAAWLGHLVQDIVARPRDRS